MVITKSQFAASLLGVGFVCAVGGIFATHMLENTEGQKIRGYAAGYVASEIEVLKGYGKPEIVQINQMITDFKLTSADLMLYNDAAVHELGIKPYKQ